MRNTTLRISGLVLAHVLASPVWADAAAPGSPTMQVELGAETSSLSNGSPDWRETSLRLTSQPEKRSVRSLGLRQSSRFGLDDHEISGQLTTPLSDRLTATVGGSLSPTHRVLPRQGLEGALQYEFAPAWLMQGGLSNRRYDTTHVDQATLMLEHYFSSFSASFAWKPVRASGVSSSSTEVRTSYYYSDASFTGLIFSKGQEATTIAPSLVVLADVRSTAWWGRHWLTRQWAVNYALTHTRQGNFYNRNSVRIGAEYAF